MAELWVTKSPTDVHRLIDNKLPKGSRCTGVAMTSLDEGTVEEFVATINGAEVITQAPIEESADDVADALVAQAPPPPPPPEPAQESAMVEGAEAPAEVQGSEALNEPMFGTEADTEEYEYDDSEDDEDDDVSDTPKPKKAKTKKKK